MNHIVHLQLKENNILYEKHVKELKKTMHKIFIHVKNDIRDMHTIANCY